MQEKERTYMSKVLKITYTILRPSGNDTALVHRV